MEKKRNRNLRMDNQTRQGKQGQTRQGAPRQAAPGQGKPRPARPGQQMQGRPAPKKKKKKNGIANFISTLLIIVCLGVVAVTGFKLFSTLKEYQDAVDEYEDMRQYVTKKESKDKESKASDKCPISVDFDALLKQNPDTVGWIYIEDSGINYPIVQNKEKGNDYYLHRTFTGESNFSGSIFLDVLCEPDFTSDNTIIYGHNLKNGEMFGHLKQMYDTKYNEKADYKKYPIVWILTPDYIMEYKVFAGREISATGDKEYYTVEFDSEEDYIEFLVNCKKKSLFKTDVDVEDGDRSITLSTCTSDTEDGRFVVQAIEVQLIEQ